MKRGAVPYKPPTHPTASKHLQRGKVAQLSCHSKPEKAEEFSDIAGSARYPSEDGKRFN